MYHPDHAADRACDCRCRVHHGQLRATYNDPACHCQVTCASQPMTLLAPQINGALFLDRHAALWFVPGLEPGHWDWQCAHPVDTSYLLAEINGATAAFLHATAVRLQPLAHRL